MKKSWLLISVMALIAYAEGMENYDYFDESSLVSFSEEIADADGRDEEVQPSPKKSPSKPSAKAPDQNRVKPKSSQPRRPLRTAPKRPLPVQKQLQVQAEEQESVEEEVEAPVQPAAKPASRSKFRSKAVAQREEAIAQEEVEEQQEPVLKPKLKPKLKKQEPIAQEEVEVQQEPAKPAFKPKFKPRSALKKQEPIAQEEAAPQPEPVKPKSKLPPKNAPKVTQAPKKQPTVSYVSKRNLADNSYDNMSNSMGNGNNGNGNGMGSQKPQQNTWDGHRMPVYGEAGWLDVEFLWWRADENGLDYALSKEFAVFQNASFDAGVPLDGLAGHMKHAGFDWKPGFRVGAGYKMERDAWQIFGQYTWYKSRNHKHANVPGRGAAPNLNGTFPEFTLLPMTSADSEVSLHYELGDLYLGRNFELSRYILLNLFAGPRGAWIHQGWEVKYFSAANGATTTHKVHWGFRGYGLQLGINSDWYIGWGFNLFVQGAASGFWGVHHDRTQSVSTFSQFPIQKASLKDRRTVQSTQLMTGLNWGDTWGRIGFNAYLAWELNSWYNLAEHYRASPTPQGANIDRDRNLTTSTLSLHGLTAGVSVSF